MQATTSKTEYTRWLLMSLGANTAIYLLLCMALNDLEFYWILADDKNRATDAKELRSTYIEKHGDYILDDLPASATVLEVLVALSNRANDVIYETPYTWFCIFLKNLGLDYLTNDNWTEDGEAFVKATIHKWLDRRISANGSGSPFRSMHYSIIDISMWDALQWYLADFFGEGHI